MRFIFKTAILATLLFTSLMANIDECKTDLYYANGIMMPDSEEKALMKWRKKAYDLLFSKPETYKKISDIKISYNISESFIEDILESFEQVRDNEWGWKEFTSYYEAYLEGYNLKDQTLHVQDLTKQVESYKQSIRDGHGVVVLAHSQGNYYTNEAYEELPEWMRTYFHMFGIATPANHVAGYESGDATAPYVKFHNDFIMAVVTGLPSNRDNPNPEHAGNIYFYYLPNISFEKFTLGDYEFSDIKYRRDSGPAYIGETLSNVIYYGDLIFKKVFEKNPIMGKLVGKWELI